MEFDLRSKFGIVLRKATLAIIVGIRKSLAQVRGDDIRAAVANLRHAVHASGFTFYGLRLAQR